MKLPVVEDRRFALLAAALVQVGEKDCEVSAAVKDVIAADNLKRTLDEAIVELSKQSDSTLDSRAMRPLRPVLRSLLERDGMTVKAAASVVLKLWQEIDAAVSEAARSHTQAIMSAPSADWVCAVRTLHQ